MYEIGILVALAIWLVKLIFAFQILNSNMNNNLNQIGQRLSWLDLSPKPLTKEYLQQGLFFKILKFLVLWVIIPFLLTFTSWLYVVYSAGVFLYKKNKDSGKPIEIKELQWRLKNQNLNFDQVVEIMVKASNMDESKLEEYKEAIRSEMRSNGLI